MITDNFSIPIYSSMIEEPYLTKIQDELDAVFETLHQQNRFQRKTGWGPGTHKLSDNSFQSNLIEDYNLSEFKMILRHHLKQFTDSVNLDWTVARHYKIKVSWMTSTSKGEYAHIHHHHLSTDISGVYYYKTNGNDGSIFFINPCAMFSTTLLENLPNHVEVAPQVGKLLLFPSWLQHGVHMNHTDNERVSVSFNITFIKN